MRQSIALAAALVALTACSGDKAAKAAADSTAAAAVAAAAAVPTTPPVITITAKDFAYESPDTATGGMVTIKLVNQGPSMHHVQLIHLTDGKTAADLEAGLKASKPGSPPPPWAVPVAGPNSPVPGGESSITEQLEVGNYAVICFIPDAAGVPHFMKGMIRPLTVVAAKTASAPAPTADVNVKLTDFAFEITPALTAGKHIIKIENAAEQPHEMLIAMLAPGKKPSDLVAWVGKQVGPPPGKPLGGISGMAKGGVVYLSVDLEPGEYGVFCFLDDVKDGKMHVEHGMLKQISVK
ncbi:MAG: hypothetical protein ABI852_08855 [Gemmatimonadaceae bacterium]